MEQFEKLSALFEGQAGEDLLESQLAMLAMYEKLLATGTPDQSGMNELIKAALGAQIALLKSGGGLNEQLLDMQRGWISNYRDLLESQLQARRAAPNGSADGAAADKDGGGNDANQGAAHDA